MRPPPFRSVAVLILATMPLVCRAAETVTLRSGFTIVCDRHESLSAETVRLHLRSAGTSADNTMDVASASIANIEITPELPNALPSPASTGADFVADSGARHNVSVALLAAVIKAESGGNARAVSRAGARGLMQLMPATAAQLHVADSSDAAGNVNGGSAYLDMLLTRYHDNVALALAAYNAGPAAVDRYHGVPPFHETRAYVARVIREFNRRVAEQARAASATAVR